MKYSKEIPSLKTQVQRLNEETQRLEHKKTESTKYLNTLLDQLAFVESSLKKHRMTIDEKREYIQDLDVELKSIVRLIEITKKEEGYQKIEKVFVEKANDTLLEKKAIISLALVSVIEAIKSSNNNSNNANQQYYGYYYGLHSSHYDITFLATGEIVKLAEKLFCQKLSKMFVNSTMYSTNSQP